MKTNKSYRNCLRKCAFLFLCICVALPFSACENYETPREWTPVYNSHERHGASFYCATPDIEEELTEEEIAAILPRKPLPFEITGATARFMEDTETDHAYMVALYVRGSADDSITITFGITAHENACCSFNSNGAAVSLCGNVEYKLYESEDDLMAIANINGTPMWVRTFGRMTKQEFEMLLECFSWYSDSKPDLSKILPQK